MAKKLDVGDRVTWHTGMNDTQGFIIECRVENTEFDGDVYTASEDDPTFIVESEHGHRAARHGGALRRA